MVSAESAVPLTARTIAAMAQRIAATPISIQGLRSTNVSTINVSSRAVNATMPVFQKSRLIDTEIRQQMPLTPIARMKLFHDSYNVNSRPKRSDVNRSIEA